MKSWILRSLCPGSARLRRPQEPFFGTGPAAFEGDASNYGVESERAELHLRLRRGTRVRREAGAWLGDRQNVHRSGRERDRPSFETVFPPLAPDALGVEQHHVITGVRFALDTRSGRPHWSGGARLDAQAERFSGRNAGSPGFRRYTLAGQVGWSFMRDPRTLRLAARVVDVVPLDRTRPPLLSDLSRLGGSAGLDGFEPGRFHDLDLLVVKLGYIFPLVEYAELELSTEIGGVSGDVWRETRIDRIERSYSVMLRPRKHTAPLGAFGVSWSREGTRVRFALGGVE